MSDVKCPICNDGKIIAYPDGTYECDNAECSIYNGTHTETFEALIRTRKALDVAVDALKEINDRYESEEQRGREEDDSPDWWDFSMDTGEILAKALEKIKALEQKDVK